jgi:hypothetical protein
VATKVHTTLVVINDAQSFQGKKMQSITRRQAIAGTVKGVVAYVASASAMADHCLVDISAGADPNECHAKPVPTVPPSGLAALGVLMLLLATRLYRR